MEKATTVSAPFIRSSLPPDKKKLLSRISFRVKTTDIGNQYDSYSQTRADGSSMVEYVNFTVSYTSVSGILSLYIIINITYAEGLIIFIMDISNSF